MSKLDKLKDLSIAKMIDEPETMEEKEIASDLQRERDFDEKRFNGISIFLDRFTENLKRTKSILTINSEELKSNKIPIEKNHSHSMPAIHLNIYSPSPVIKQEIIATKAHPKCLTSQTDI